MKSKTGSSAGFFPGRSSVVPLRRSTKTVAGQLRLSPNDRMKSLISHPDAQKLVRKLPVQDFYVLVKQVGLDDSIELIELASARQIQRAMDIDVWDRDLLRLDLYREWLQALVEAKGDSLPRLFTEVDPEPLVYYLSQHVKVYLKDDDLGGRTELELNAADMIETQDGLYLLEFFSTELEDHDFILAFIQKIYRSDLKTARWLLACIQHEVGSELLETAFRLRSGRMEELGFVDYYEALNIYSPINTKTADPPVKHPQIDPTTANEGSEPSGAPAGVSSGGRGNESPILSEFWRPSDHLLVTRVLESMEDVGLRDRISRDFLRLANKIVVADRSDPSDLDALRTALEKARGGVNIGLEQQSQGQDDIAARVLRQQHPESLFRQGYSRQLELHREAQSITQLLTNDLPLTLDDPFQRIVEGCLRVPIAFYRGLERSHFDDFKPFSASKQIEQTANALREARDITEFFCDRLQFEPETRAALREFGQQTRRPISPRALASTAFIRWVLGDGFEPLPLSSHQLGMALKSLIVESPDRKMILRQESLTHFRDMIEQSLVPSSPPGTLPLREFFRDVIKRIELHYTIRATADDERVVLLEGPILCYEEDDGGALTVP